MKLDKESTVSLYMQLMHVIKEQIHNGTYLEGEQIPTEGELSKMYNISRISSCCRNLSWSFKNRRRWNKPKTGNTGSAYSTGAWNPECN